MFTSLGTLALNLCETGTKEGGKTLYRHHFMWIGEPIEIKAKGTLESLKAFCSAKFYDGNLGDSPNWEVERPIDFHEAKRELYLWYDQSNGSNQDSINANLNEFKELQEYCQKNGIEVIRKHTEVLLAGLEADVKLKSASGLQDGEAAQIYQKARGFYQKISSYAQMLWMRDIAS